MQVRDKCLVVVLCQDLKQVQDLRDDFLANTIGYAHLILAIDRNDRQSYPTDINWIYYRDYFWHLLEKLLAISSSYHKYAQYILTSDRIRFPVGGWDYRMKDLLDALEGNAVIDFDYGITATKNDLNHLHSERVETLNEALDLLRTQAKLNNNLYSLRFLATR